MYTPFGNVLVVIAAIVLFGCATALRHAPVSFTPTRAAAPQTIVIEKAVDVEPVSSSGYARTLKAGSVWKEVGTVPQGTVYKVEDDVFMLEAAHMHEAYCVIQNNTLVGFYLPVEQAFVAAYEKVSLPIKTQ